MLEKDFVEYVIKTLVRYPEKVKITVNEGDNTNVILVEADNMDYGKIMGHRGVFINSIRNLLNVVSRNSDKRWVIDVPDRSER